MGVGGVDVVVVIVVDVFVVVFDVAVYVDETLLRL